MENNFNLNDDMINNIKNMVDNGNISDAISQISPEMIQNFSKMLKSNDSQSNSENNNSDFNSSNTNNDTNNNGNNNNFNLNGLDPNTVMKITSALGKMNNKNDPRANLLYSLKPYLRDSRQEKLNQYVNLLNVTKITELLKDKDDKKKGNNNG